jgi:hypothetical protein
MFVVIYKWLSKTVFTHRAANGHAPARPSRSVLSPSSLVRVPSQSWQVIVFTRKWCWSMTGVFRTCDAVIGIRSWSQVTWRMGNGPPRTGSPTVQQRDTDHARNAQNVSVYDSNDRQSPGIKLCCEPCCGVLTLGAHSSRRADAVGDVLVPATPHILLRLPVTRVISIQSTIQLLY